MLAGCLRSTIICQKTAAQMTAEVGVVIIVKTVMFIIREFVLRKDVQEVIAMNVLSPMKKELKIVSLTVQMEDALYTLSVGSMICALNVIIVLGADVSLYPELQKLLFVEKASLVVIVVSKKGVIRDEPLAQLVQEQPIFL
ncbi:unnamed protein product [marine sediment metagenome]|uniref:Uncharacterized protein n=1 Tax=marine sediment metagenome TaxID=412755 RepID=X1MN08_9ZZZZ